MKTPPASTVERFWRWFASVAEEFAANLANEQLLEGLDRRVAGLGPVTWEVGPGERKANALVVSPGGDKALLALTRGIVAAAPEIPNWEIHAAKPPKQWDFKFSVDRRNGDAATIDASGWEYVLLRFPDGSYQVELRAPDLMDLDEETRVVAAELAVEGTVGEATRLELIAGIDVLPAFEEDQAHKATNLKHLRDHLRVLTRT